jgi:hypothetical protein
MGVAVISQDLMAKKYATIATSATKAVKSYCATVDAPSDTVPCGQCSDYNGTLATCSVDRGLEVDSNGGWTTIYFKSKKSKRGKSNVQSMKDQRTFSSGSI